MATVPNLAGKSIYNTDVKDALTAAHLTCGVAHRGTAGNGTVYQQTPAAGATVADGSAVDVTYHFSTGGMIVWGN